MTGAKFSDLIGKVVLRIEGTVGDDVMRFHCEDGSIYRLYHEPDCCESVSVYDICGDIMDLIGVPILDAREESSESDPADVKRDTKWVDSCTWTFYILATIKGYVTIRWYGESNGYYSEAVFFMREAV